MDSLVNIADFKAKSINSILTYKVNKKIPIFIHGDYKKIFKVLLNLLLNAIDHLSENRIEISVDSFFTDSGENLRFTISNSILNKNIVESKEKFLNSSSFIFKKLDYSDKIKKREESWSWSNTKFKGSHIRLFLSECISECISGKIFVKNENENEINYIFEIPLTPVFWSCPVKIEHLG